MSKSKAAKPSLSRERIAETALAIADRQGFNAVSMRRIAEELNVGTMSLYYYVKTKDELVAAMDDALMGEILLPSMPKPWRRALMEIAKRTHAMYVRHPWSFVAMIAARPGLNAMRHMEQCLQALAGTPLSEREKLTLLTTLDDFVFGYSLRTGAANTSVNIEFAKAQIATGAFPRLKEAFVDARARPDDKRFERGVAALLDAVTKRKLNT